MTSKPSQLSYQMLYPPEGNSSILEVSLQNVGEFCHVRLDDKGEQIWTFFSPNPMPLSKGQIDEIAGRADKNLKLTDYSAFDEEMET